MSTTNWRVPTLTLCTYGFLKEMKPSEPFLTPYLNSSFKHIDQKALSDQVYPIATYANFIFLYLVFISTDVLRYKPLIILESLAYLGTRTILVWGDGIPLMQLMQITYGLASATETAYYAYIYAIVDIQYYQRVTSYTRAVTLFGRGVSGILGQILISTKTANYLHLNYISFVSVSIAVFVSFFLPKVTRRIFTTENERPINTPERANRLSSWRSGLRHMFKSFKDSFSNKYLLMWSVWWAFAMCGGLQVENYAMNLWSTILGPKETHVYNGAVFASGTMLSGIVVGLLSLVKVQWNVTGEVVIGLVSVLEAIILCTMSYTKNIWIAYVCYVLFRVSFAFILTVASLEIALHVKLSGYALIFGWNTFIALALQSLLTFIVNDKKGLDLDDRQQFLVYGCYFGTIALVFLLRPLLVFCKRLRRCCNQSTPDAIEAVQEERTI